MVQMQRRYTADEWLDSPQNTKLAELVDGITVERMPTSGDHGEAVGVLWDWLRVAQHAGHGRAYAGPTGVLLDPDGARNNVREPDLYFFRQGRNPRRMSKGIEGVPDFVIEILSPGNEKAGALRALPGGSVWRSYERFGVPHYWIVDLESKTVTQFEHHQGRFVEQACLHAGDTLISPLFPDLPLTVADLFAELDS